MADILNGLNLKFGKLLWWRGSQLDVLGPGTSGQVLNWGADGTPAPHTLTLPDIGSVFATPTIALGTAYAAGAAATTIRSDSTLLAFDATAPTTSAPGDAAAVGAATVTARRDHTHGREANTWTTPGFSGGNFTSSAGTWTVESGDVLNYSYVIIGKTMCLTWTLATTSLTVATSNQLRIAIPASKTATHRQDAVLFLSDPTAGVTIGLAFVQASTAYVACVIGTGGGNWALSTNATLLVGQITFEIN